MHHVVIWDPDGDYWEGAIVDSQRVNELRARGVALLPCVPEVFRLAGCSGFAKRAWGAGWPLDTVVPAIVCPLTIFAPAQPVLRTLHWSARLVPAESGRARLAAGKEVAQGVLQLAASEQRSGQHRAVVSDSQDGTNAISIASLGKPDAEGGWTVEGRAFLHASSEGFYGLALYGCAPGLRVEWLASTLTP
jgi:hypothetical protein